MILFNLIVSQITPELSRDPAANSKHATVFLKSCNSISKSFALAYTAKYPEVLTVSNTDLAKQKLAKQSQWQKILNSVWRQVIFLSIPSKSYNKYTVDLGYLNMYKQQSASKQLLSEFSRSLLQGSVSSSLSSELDSSFSHLSSVQYSLRKNLRRNYEEGTVVSQDNAYQDLLSRVKQYVHRSDCVNHFPLFVVSNYLGQMIISEPPSELTGKTSGLDSILSSNYGNRVYQGWFFTSFEDAKEYMRTIGKYYNLREEHLKIFACNFNTFYRIMDKFGDKIHFRLLPDLGEVACLTKSYRHYGNLSFHKNQKYGRGYFQGQPLYILKVKDEHEEHLVKSGFKILDQYQLIFSDYRTACSTWSRLTSGSLNSGKCMKPNLTVYNLESFIQDEAYKDDKQVDRRILVPSESTYWFAKKHFLQKKINLLHGNILTHTSSMQLWSKRVLWSLTSKQPCGW